MVFLSYGMNLVYSMELGARPFLVQLASCLWPLLSIPIADQGIRFMLTRFKWSKLITIRQAKWIKFWVLVLINILFFAATPKVFTD